MDLYRGEEGNTVRNGQGCWLHHVTWMFGLSEQCVGEEAWAGDPSPSSQGNLETQTLTNLDYRSVGGRGLCMTLWPEATVSLTQPSPTLAKQFQSAWGHVWVNPRAITQQSAESKSIWEAKDAQDARHQQHGPLHRDKRQARSFADSVWGPTTAPGNPEGRLRISLATVWGRLNGSLVKMGPEKPWDVRP